MPRMIQALLKTAVLLFACFCVTAAEFPVGSKLQDIRVTESGSVVKLAPGNAPATVVLFLSTRCPISNGYIDRLNAIYRDYHEKQVQFVFVNANNNESAADIEAHARANQLAFKVYKDVNNVLADQLNATVTPEAFVFDKQGTLQYHGYVDDATNAARVRVNGLRNAMDAVLAGQPVQVKESKAFGCTIKKVRKVS